MSETWEGGHRVVTAAEFIRWIEAYPRPLTTRIRESATGLVLHVYLDDARSDPSGQPRCVASVQPSTGLTLGATYRIHGEPMKREPAA